LLTALSYLDLDENFLTGSIPSEVEALPNYGSDSFYVKYQQYDVILSPSSSSNIVLRQLRPMISSTSGSSKRNG